MQINNEELKQAARAEFDRIPKPDAFIEELCVRNARGFLPYNEQAATIIVPIIIHALRKQRSLSVLRVGNSEGNLIALSKAPTKTLLTICRYELWAQGRHNNIPERDLLSFSFGVYQSLLSADIIGFRSLDSRIAGSEMGIISNTIASKNSFGALGILHARDFLQTGLIDNLFLDKILTSAWIHLPLIHHLEEMMSESVGVTVISGRPELEVEVRKRARGRFRNFFSVPGESSVPQSPDLSHFSCYPKLVELIEKSDLAGNLVLVGAGLFGKIYCHAARRSGAVAIDMGSSFDLLAGIATRPVHKVLKIDPATTRWT